MKLGIATLNETINTGIITEYQEIQQEKCWHFDLEGPDEELLMGIPNCIKMEWVLGNSFTAGKVIARG